MRLGGRGGAGAGACQVRVCAPRVHTRRTPARLACAARTDPCGAPPAPWSASPPHALRRGRAHVVLYLILILGKSIERTLNPALQAEFNQLANELARQYPDRARLWFAYDEPLRWDYCSGWGGGCLSSASHGCGPSLCLPWQPGVLAASAIGVRLGLQGSQHHLRSQRLPGQQACHAERTPCCRPRRPPAPPQPPIPTHTPHTHTHTSQPPHLRRL